MAGGQELSFGHSAFQTLFRKSSGTIKCAVGHMI